MPIDNIVVIAAIIVAFGLFGATLAWVSTRTQRAARSNIRRQRTGDI
jgi:hypothetical protein